MISRHRAQMMWETSQTMRRELFYSQLLTDAQAAKEVRLFGLGGFFRRRMLDELSAVQHANRRVDRRELVVQGLLGLMGAVVAGAGLVWAVRAAVAGQLSIGDVSVFVAAVAGTQSTLGSIVRETATGHQALLIFDHYQAIVTGPSDLRIHPRRVAPGPLRGGVELRDVWFRYSDEHPWILRGVDLTIPSGTAVALVGLNGAGKSTLVKLLCRFYDPTRGSVSWDGVDLRDLDIERLRARIGGVFQDFMTYDLTARENIGVGDLDALPDLDRVRSAARGAQVDDALASLPRGYETMLTRMFFRHADKDDQENGVLLSGGQRQRIGLAEPSCGRSPTCSSWTSPARAWTPRPNTTSTSGSGAIGRGRPVCSSRTGSTRSATPTPSSCSKGRIVEQGRHDDLVAAGGRYSRLFSLQARGYEDVGAVRWPG